MKPLRQVLNIHDNHICRSEPKEATIFSLFAKGKDITQFTGCFRADMSVDLIKEPDIKTQIEASVLKIEHSSLTLPLQVPLQVSLQFVRHEIRKVAIKFS